MKTMLKNKFVFSAIFSLSVLFSGVAFATDTLGVMEEGSKMKEDAMMKKEGMMGEGQKMKDDMVKERDSLKEEGRKLKEAFTFK